MTGGAMTSRPLELPPTADSAAAARRFVGADVRGRVTAVLVHAEDVTAFFPTPPPIASDGVAPAAEMPQDRWGSLQGALQHERKVSHHLREQVETLREALDTNRQISVAVGLLMAATGLNRERAFQLLVKRSQSTHQKLREVTVAVVREYEAG